MIEKESNLENALKYLSIGWSVFPIIPESKKPIFKWKKYQHQLPTEQQVSRWWSQFPDANIALATGETSGVDAVDIDGTQERERFEATICQLPETIMQKTGREGAIQAFFSHGKNGLKNVVGVGEFKGIDLKTNGGYVILPPSLHKSGRRYSWLNIDPIEDGLNDLLEMPTEIVEHFKKQNGGNGTDRSPLTLGSVPNGQRNSHLARLAGRWVGKGLNFEEVMRLATSWYEELDDKEDFTEKEVETTVRSVFKAHQRNHPGVASRMRDWLDAIEGVFTTKEIYEDLNLRDESDKSSARVALNRFAKQGLIEREKRRSGTYRKVQSELKKMDLRDVDTQTIELWLPLGIHNLVNFYAGNIILVAGDPNVGKTAFLMNVVKENIENFKIHYFSSEMGKEEMLIRAKLFENFPTYHKNFNPYEQHEDFADVIQQGKGNLNIIDYLEVVEDFWIIGKYLKDIHQKLDGALAVVAVQKRHPSSDDPLGGKRGLEKPRLALSMGWQKIKIVKAKNWKSNKTNPNNLEISFKLYDGCKFENQTSWQHADGTT